ncbi:MAG: hypothetical protein Q9159_007157, partial [Coniocarpon cinnabarinum]
TVEEPSRLRQWDNAMERKGAEIKAQKQEREIREPPESESIMKTLLDSFEADGETEPTFVDREPLVINPTEEYASDKLLPRMWPILALSLFDIWRGLAKPIGLNF